MRPAGSALIAFAAAILSGCATPAPPTAPTPVSDAGTPRRAAYATASAHAEDAEQAGQLRDAAWWWSVAEAIVPDSAAASAGRERVRKETARRVTLLLDEGDRNVKRRAVPQAYAAYQRALVLDPQSPRVRAALRQIEGRAVLNAVAHGGGGGPPAPPPVRRNASN